MCVTCDFTANTTFTDYRSPLIRCLKTSEQHQKEGCIWIQACAYIETNMVHLWTIFIHLHVHCACARMYKIQEYHHLASLGWNFNMWHLVATGCTFCGQDTSSTKLHSLLCYCEHGFWRTWFWPVFEWIYPRYCLNYHRKCLDLLYTWDLINIKGCVLCVLLVFLLQMLLSPLIAQRQST